VCHEEGDLVHEPPARPPGLSGGLVGAHDDVAEAQHPVVVDDEVPDRLRPAGAAGKPLSEREDVGRAIDVPMAAVQLPLRGVVDERERDLGVPRELERTERRADGRAERRERARGAPGDRDPQDAAGRIRVMRSSGYGMRS